MSPLAAIAVHFALLSLVAIGGVSVVLPEMHRLAVDVHGWMTAEQFTDLFVIARAAPGPNVMLVTLVGWQAAGLPGALVATAAMIGPPCVLTYWIARTWQRFHGARWRRAIEAGLAPITVGLVLATGYLLTQVPGAGWVAHGITAATVACVLWTRLNPLWLFAAGGLLGVLGLV